MSYHEVVFRSGRYYFICGHGLSLVKVYMFTVYNLHPVKTFLY